MLYNNILKNHFTVILVSLFLNLSTFIYPETSFSQEGSSELKKQNPSIIDEIKTSSTEAIQNFNNFISSFLFATIEGTVKKYSCEVPDSVICSPDSLDIWKSFIVTDVLIQLPFLILWLVVAGVFFTLRLNFVNFRLFFHSFDVIKGRYSKDSDPGEITHFQALSSAISGTVGLGNIAGVAVAVAVGGPGAIIWMMIAGFLGMSTKFAEVTMGLKYRDIFPDGTVNGGAYEYLSKGLAELNLKTLGKILALIFTICCIGGSIGGGNMFQSNQAVAIMADTFEPLKGMEWAISLFIAILVGIILIGGIKRIAEVASRIVPIMAVTYVISCLVIIGVNIENLGSTISLMFSSAFAYDAAVGGMIGAIINGFKRAAFSSEAGVGSAPTAHSAAKTKEPVREGAVALLEPFIDTIVVCFVSGLAIIISQSYIDTDANGVVMTSIAFKSVSSWFPIILSIAIFLFAFSTIITWGYYGSKAFAFIFGEKSQIFFKFAFCVFTFIGGIVNLSVIIDFSDLLLLSMALPNLLGLYFLSGTISRETKEYIRKLKNDEFEKNW